MVTAMRRPLTFARRRHARPQAPPAGPPPMITTLPPSERGPKPLIFSPRLSTRLSGSLPWLGRPAGCPAHLALSLPRGLPITFPQPHQAGASQRQEEKPAVGLIPGQHPPQHPRVQLPFGRLAGLGEQGSLPRAQHG